MIHPTKREWHVQGEFGSARWKDIRHSKCLSLEVARLLRDARASQNVSTQYRIVRREWTCEDYPETDEPDLNYEI